MLTEHQQWMARFRSAQALQTLQPSAVQQSSPQSRMSSATHPGRLLVTLAVLMMVHLVLILLSAAAPLLGTQSRLPSGYACHLQLLALAVPVLLFMLVPLAVPVLTPSVRPLAVDLVMNLNSAAARQRGLQSRLSA
jgi:hypothetical protein